MIKKPESETEKKTSADESEKARAAADETKNDSGVDVDVDVKDAVEISTESAEKTGTLADELKKMADELKEFEEQLEISRKQSEGAAEGWRVLIRCLKIASRIMNGDIVPKEDHRYLAEHDPKLYAKAITLRVHNDDPKKYKRVSEDEKQDKAEKENNKADAASADPVNDAVNEAATAEDPEAQSAEKE